MSESWPPGATHALLCGPGTVSPVIDHFKARLIRGATLFVGLLLVLSACSTAGRPTTTTSSPSPEPQVLPPSTTTIVGVAGDQIPPLGLSTAELGSLPGRLVINHRQSVTVIGSDLALLPLGDSQGEVGTQPTWSPDGRSVAWSRVTVDGTAAVIVSSATDGSSTEYVTPFQVFYIQWRPDSGALGVLGAGGEGTALAIIDLGDGQVTEMHSAGSFYFVWSPDGKTLVTHLNGSIIELVDVASGERTPIDTETGTFEAPQWTADGNSIIYIRPVIIQTAGLGGFLAAQATSDELVMHKVATGEVTVLAEGIGMSGFSLSTDGTKIAYTAGRSGTETGMFVVDLASGEQISLGVGLVFAWQWSPDSRKILVFGIEDAGMVLRVWNDGTVKDYFRAVPTGTFLNRYLIFWGQYARSMSVWAPDSSAFVFAAIDRGDDYILLQRVEDEFPSLVAPGSVASFSPAGGSTN